MNNISEARRQTFKAAWEIQRMMYGEGFWMSELAFLDDPKPGERRRTKVEILGDCVGRSDRNSRSENQSNCEPQMGESHGGRFGRILSREGLMVIWSRGFPTWMETPWGEWWCWAEYGPGHSMGHYASIKYHQEFLSRVRVEKEPDGRSHVEHSVLRQVGEIILPKHSRVGGDELPKEEMVARSAEWVMLCEEMQPQRFPYWFTYVQGNLPIPKNHPHYEYAQKEISGYRKYNESGMRAQYAAKHAPA